MQTSENKPSLVQSGQGFSILYKNKYLYSRYNPSRAIISVIEKLELLPHTLIVVFSPCLWYGIEELLEKAKNANCSILAIENDAELYSLAKEQLAKIKHTYSIQFIKAADALYTIETLSESGKLKRAIRLDFSAGVQLYQNEYTTLFNSIQSIIALFWKNRITLVRFGRLFSRNVIKNISRLPSISPLHERLHTISTPIFVFGAGESTETLLQAIDKSLIEKCYTIAVDAAALALKAHDIRIDGIATVEAQSVIDACFIGIKEEQATVYADLCSRAIRHTFSSGEISAFMSEYSSAAFLKRLSSLSILPPIIKPLGSVGLVAVELAKLLRSNESVPIFTVGLDFSYSIGLTHTKESPQHKRQLRTTTRLTSLDNISAAFATGTQKFLAKNKKPMITTQNMSGYARLFAQLFSATPYLFDCAQSGVSLGLPLLQSEQLSDFLSKLNATSPHKTIKTSLNTGLKSKIIDFYTEEEAALLHIKELLIHGENAMSAKEKESGDLSSALLSLLRERDYLYLHFPDGFAPSTDTAFLKRVRAEIDVFLKDIRLSRQCL